MPPTWRWNLGHALLPFRFHVHGEQRANGGVPTLWWEPYNRSALRLYNRLHAHKEDDRYCDALPCATVAASAKTAARAAAMLNATLCGSMDECFARESSSTIVAPSSGKYYYQGEHTGAFVG